MTIVLVFQLHSPRGSLRVGLFSFVLYQVNAAYNQINDVPVFYVPRLHSAELLNALQSLASSMYELLLICGCYGVDREDVELLLDIGYTCDEIEEMLLDDTLMQEALTEAKTLFEQ